MKRCLIYSMFFLILLGCPRTNWMVEEIRAMHDDLRQIESHETYLYGQDRLASGCRGAFRVLVKKPVSLTENAPVPRADVVVSLEGKGTKAVLYEGKTDEEGHSNVQFQLPDLPAGEYQLRVTTSSPYGKDEVWRSIEVERKEKILLVTDKPIYQPAQTIHIRALALHSMTLRPLSKEIMLEVEDSKGNKVFKQKTMANEYGIASASFELADEVNMGTYCILATMGEVTAKKTVNVEKYVLPKFKIALSTEKRYFLPGEKVEGTVQADYFFGKPVAGGKVKLVASTFDVEFKDFWSLEGTTGENGIFAFEFSLPAYFVGQPLEQGNAMLKIEAEVTDKAEHTEKKTATFPVASDALSIAVVPEGGKFIPGIANQIFVVASYPDGTPARARVQLTVLTAQKQILETTTDENGLAILSLLVKQEEMQAKSEETEIDSHYTPSEECLQVLVKATDARGNSGEALLSLRAVLAKETVLLRPNKAIYQGGETLKFEILSSAQSGSVYLDVVKERQTVLTKTVELSRGRGSLTLDTSQDFFGTLECHAYKFTEGGDFVRDSRIIYVYPPGEVQISVNPNQKVYRPQEEASILFRTTDKDGKPVPAALGIIVVDEAVYALQEMQPGLERVYFTLEKELAQPKYQIRYGPGGNLETILRDPIPTSDQREATLLFACIEGRTPHTWQQNPYQLRGEGVKQQLAMILAALIRYAEDNSLFEKKSDGSLIYRAGLLDLLVKKGYMDPVLMEDPFLKKKLTLERLSRMDPSFSPEILARIETSWKINRIYENLGKKALSSEENCDLLKRDNIRDVWGNAMHCEIVVQNRWRLYFNEKLSKLSITSPGPDGKINTDDDVRNPLLYMEIQSMLKCPQNSPCQALRYLWENQWINYY